MCLSLLVGTLITVTDHLLLLFGGQRDRRRDGQAAMLADRGGASPGAVEGAEVGTQCRQCREIGLPISRLHGGRRS